MHIDLSTLPSSPTAAREAGSKFYFTGLPCPQGHIARRRVKGTRCCECESEINKRQAHYIKEYHRKNPEKNRVASRKYKKQHRERVLAARRDYFRRNKHRYAHWQAARRARLRNATPPWANFAEIEKLYERADELTRITGIPHVVDHIVPLAGKNVCGLHVHFNLRVITKTHNAIKGNKVINE